MARDGREALGLLGNGYYALIVSDVDMPGLSGIDFFKKASAAYPNIKDRFLFFTGNNEEGRISFFRENSLRYILKTYSQSQISAWGFDRRAAFKISAIILNI